MDHREVIIQKTIDLIRSRNGQIETITVRDITKNASIGLGLVNYHFGSKDALMELCVERIVNEIVQAFETLRTEADELSPRQKLQRLGMMTFTFLFDHEAVSRTSILSEMKTPKADDNTHRTWKAFLPLVAACRPDWDPQTLERKTFELITVMQQAFLRHEAILQESGLDLKDLPQRNQFHDQVLSDILEDPA